MSGRGRRGFRRDPESVGDGIGEAGRAGKHAAKVDVGLGRVHGIEADLDFVADQMGGGFIEAFLQQERAIASDDAVEAEEEQAPDIGGGRQLTDLFDIALPAGKRRGVWR